MSATEISGPFAILASGEALEEAAAFFGCYAVAFDEGDVEALCSFYDLPFSVVGDEGTATVSDAGMLERALRGQLQAPGPRVGWSLRDVDVQSEHRVVVDVEWRLGGVSQPCRYLLRKREGGFKISAVVYPPGR